MFIAQYAAGDRFGDPRANTGWGDLLTCYDGNQLIGYDDVGNLVIMGSYIYYWKHGRQLESISDGGNPWTFTYDANGMRKSRSNGSATYTYTYNGSKLMQMTRGTDVLDFYYDASGTPVAFKHNGTTYYYATTLQGDILLILDADGEIVVSYDYDAWGKLLAIGGTMATTLGTLNPLTYRGYVYDHEYGLYYLQSRYYSPELGRFINADAFVSTGGLLGNNMFAYCGNNPVNREDPTGHAFMQVDYNTSGQPIGMFVDVGCGSASCGLFGANTVSLVEDKEPITERTGTTAYGLSLSGAFGIAGSVAFAVTFDERGNVGFMFTKSIGGGTPSAGINLFKTTTNAPSIQDQAGGGLNMGGSVSVGPLSAGGEYNMLLAGEDMYHGYTVEAGAGIGLPAEFHAAYSDTNVWEIFNLYEALWGIVIWD